MELKKITVGREHKKAFESICKLIDYGCFSDLSVKRVGDTITDGVRIYEYTEDKIERSSGVLKGFEANGASWFKALRGESVDNDNAIWTEFIENLTAEYHKRYSVLEYNQKPKTKAQKDADRNKVFLATSNLINNFFPQMKDKFEVKEENSQNEDIYGISMRLEMSGGTGASVPILGKVYFAKDGKSMTPLKTSIASMIDLGINDLVIDDGDEDLGAAPAGVVDTALNALESLVDGKFDGNFADYLCFGDKSDSDTIDGMLEKLSHDAVQLECQRLDVLSLSKLKYNNSVYTVIFNAKPAFKITLNASGTFTINCLNCRNAQPLIENNAVTVQTDDGEQNIIIDLSLEDLGILEEDIQNIKSGSSLSKHFIKITCRENPRNDGCTAWRCLDETFAVSYNGSDMLKCKDCPYPEVVYRAADGEVRYTPSLVFAFDKRDMIERGHGSDSATAKCSCCGRNFTVAAIKNRLCPTCFAADRLLDEQAAKKKYKDYHGALSLGVRLKAVGKKYCYEDDGLIIFVVGKNKYLLDKLSLKKSGYLKKPIKLK